MIDIVHSIPEQVNLMSWLFLVNQNNSMTNMAQNPFLNNILLWVDYFVIKNHKVCNQCSQTDSWTNDSYELILFSESEPCSTKSIV